MKMDIYGFYTGRIFDAYEHLGAHPTEKGILFRNFAPNAKGCAVLWNDLAVPMQKVYNNQFFEVLIEDAKVGDTYEFRIYHQDGTYTDHCDPYGFGMELRPNHRSIVRDLNSYHFDDKKWMSKRTDCKDKPLNIYELHLGSWRKNGEKWYTYRELAQPLINYVKESGYNYVEFLPLSEHPCDESWGYQNTGFYAPTSRYGTMDDLKYLIDQLHQNGIGAILDYVPVHFAIDDYGLANYDGSALYEYPHKDVGVSEWGSYNFMHSRGEVKSFLQSAANYWLKEYHFDGLRMDAISRIIYWQGDERRGVNQNAVDFIKFMNDNLKKLNPGCLLAAEDSTNYKNVTKPSEEGGLGFDYKWDMGWMHDTLEYFQLDPKLRREQYHKLTFSMMYNYNENFILPYSHDEVVHGKGTILQKMNGQYEEKFPQARAMYLYMMVHPGKKLNFMGNEIGQLREWSEKREQDWDLRKYPAHDSFYEYMKTLQQFYLSYPAFYEMDHEEEGFSWLDCYQEGKCIYAIERKSKKGRLAAIFNFSECKQMHYKVEIPDSKKVKLILNSDWESFGGKTPNDKEILSNEGKSLVVDLEPFSGILLEIV